MQYSCYITDLYIDSHFRVGGAIGTGLQAVNCPTLSGNVNPNCIAASLLLHLTSASSAYLENVWIWTADHDMDVLNNTQLDVYTGRALLVESNGPTWLYGTAAEHSVLYQYQLSGAPDVLMGMIQTESPYYQTSPAAPKPFPLLFPNDPTFANCTAGSIVCGVSWAVRIVDSSTIYVMGAGLYSWFQDYSQTCVGTNNCQSRGFEIVNSYNLWVYNLATKAIVEMISPYLETPIYAKDNVNGYLSSILGWFGGSISTSGQRKFPSFQVYEAGDWLSSWKFPDKCNTALTALIDCDDFISDWTAPAWRGALENATLTDSICDAGCGVSLASYFNGVVSSCAGYNMSDFPLTIPGGYIWDGYNQTCQTDKTTGLYCNGEFIRNPDILQT